MRKPRADGGGWLDGRPVPLDELSVSVDDPAFHAGFGLFETIAIRSGRILELDEHLDRMAEAAKRISIPLPTRDELLETSRAAAAAESAQTGWLKIVVTAGGRWMVFTGAMDPAEAGRSVSAVLLPWRVNPHDPRAGLKTLNYAHSLIGMEEARRRGADEGVWLNTRGHLAECCTSNLFVVRHRVVYTASVRDGVLPGTVRRLAIAAARQAGLQVHEGRIRLKRLEQADEAFLTSSLRGVRPLVRFEGKPVGSGSPGAITRRIGEAVARARLAVPC